jgi:hypothetical protein
MGYPQSGIASFPYASATEAKKSKTAVKCLHKPPFYVVSLMPTLCPLSIAQLVSIIPIILKAEIV